MRKTKIVCTIGPASESEEMLEKLMKAGMNVARLNFSHGDHAEHKARIDSIRKVSKKLGKTVAILLDTKGPEIRTHSMKDGGIELERDTEVIVSMTEVEGTPEKFSVTYDNLINDVEEGSYILLDDGLIELQVKRIDKDNGEVVCDVLNTGELKNKKGVNLPGVKVSLPGITDKDAEDINFGISEGVDFIAASFVRRPSDVLDIRKLLEAQKNTTISIIPKIENQEGIDNIKDILEVSDGLMVARGDMGVEIPPESVPMVQKDLIRQCNKLGKPVITATQMLDSMQRNPRATRAEASDVANAIYDGTDAVMLSGETAAGLYPEEAVKTMRNIAVSAEGAQDYKKLLSDRTKLVETSLVNAIGVSVAHTALNLNVKAIVAATESGSTARTISKYRPQSDIIAVTPNPETARQCALVWGIHPVIKEGRKTTDALLNNAVATAVETEKVQNGDLIIITAPGRVHGDRRGARHRERGSVARRLPPAARDHHEPAAPGVPDAHGDADARHHDLADRDRSDRPLLDGRSVGRPGRSQHRRRGTVGHRRGLVRSARGEPVGRELAHRAPRLRSDRRPVRRRLLRCA